MIRILAMQLPSEQAFEPEQVTPGFAGFLVFFLLGLASWLLYRSFATHMRRVGVRAKLRTEEEAERRAREPREHEEGGPLTSGSGSDAESGREEPPR